MRSPAPTPTHQRQHANARKGMRQGNLTGGRYRDRGWRDEGLAVTSASRLTSHVALTTTTTQECEQQSRPLSMATVTEERKADAALSWSTEVATRPTRWRRTNVGVVEASPIGDCCFSLAATRAPPGAEILVRHIFLWEYGPYSMDASETDMEYSHRVLL
jgi:hypothetical protein